MISNFLAPFRRPLREDVFLQIARRYGRRLKTMQIETTPLADKGHAAFVVQPWQGTVVPFFSMELARMFRLNGWRVTAIFDFNNIVGNARVASHREAIMHALRLAKSWLPFVEVIPGAPTEEDVQAAQGVAQINAIYRMRGESRAVHFHDERPDSAAAIAAHFRGVRDVISQLKPDRLIIPGGIYGASHAYVRAAEQRKIPFTTYDSGAGLLRLTRNGVAAHLADLSEALGHLQDSLQTSPEKMRRAAAIAREELDDRMNCRDFRHFQVVSSGRKLDHPYDILVPLNIAWDTAALGREVAFPSISQWLRSLLEWTARRSDVSICIRQHPRERLDLVRGSDDWSALVEPYSSLLGNRLRFVPATEEISTYDLVREAAVVLPHTSTFGIEAALLGKPVILGTRCYYSDSGFVWRASNPDQYFALIDQALRGDLIVTQAASDAAALAYFLTQRCAFVRTDFNPQPDSLEKWVGRPSCELWSSPELTDCRSALLEHEPLASIRARRLLS